MLIRSRNHAARHHERICRLAVALGLALAATLPSRAFAQAAFQRCAEDRLVSAQALERVEWFQKNYPAELLQVVLQLAYPDTLTQEQAITYYRTMMLIDPVKGGPARRPYYPTFTTDDPPNFSNPQHYRAPGYAGTDRNSPANKPANYFWELTCSACLPLAAQKACGNQECGSAADGCGGRVACGRCPIGERCIANSYCESRDECRGRRICP